MNKFKVGDCVSRSVIATDEVVHAIAEVSGDVNPVHLDEAYAKKTVFGKRIAHALFCLNGISMIIGNDIPGRGAILMMQEFNYKRPVYINDKIEISVMIKDIDEIKGVYNLETLCVNQKGQVVLDGNSKVKWRP